MMKLDLRIKDWRGLARASICNPDNLHRIAIANLEDEERQLIRWWCKKYKQPEKPLRDYTLEEIFVEYLEDYYEDNPQEATKFLQEVVEWDGEYDPEVERDVQRRLAKINTKKPVDTDKYRSEDDENLTDEQVRAILDGLGRDLPGSRLVQSGKTQPALGSGSLDPQDKPQAVGEFTDEF